MEEKTTYILECRNGRRKRITVPASWKVTFGPAAIGGTSRERGQMNPSGRYDMPMALRFYESEKVQRAIFTDVVSFRDSSIELEVEEERVQEKAGFVEMEGVRKRTTFRAATKEWVNPDMPQPDQDIPRLPEDEDMFDI